MIGTFVKTEAVNTAHQNDEATWNYLREMSSRDRVMLSDSGLLQVSNIRHLLTRLKFYRSCVPLREQFQIVERDKECARQFKVGTKSNETIDAPLVFCTKLPAGKTTSWERYERNRSIRVTARTPHPTMEALEAIRKHRHLFDWIELWWVPNDVLVEVIPNPDPIVVGVKDVRFRGTYDHLTLHFELHRWEDEDVEDPWWSKEGY